MPIVKHTTHGGIPLEFPVYPNHTAWNDIPGVYIFATVQPDGRYFPLYVGKTNSFKTRFAAHETWDAAVRQGMTCVLATVQTSELVRHAIEEQLIQELQPPLNIQGKSKPIDPPGLNLRGGLFSLAEGLNIPRGLPLAPGHWQ